MKKLLYITLFSVGMLFTSCKNESLQSYLVESQDKKEFSHISIPSTILQLGNSSISQEDKKTYESIKKVNITGLLKKNAREGQYEAEKLKLKAILKNSNYKTLMNFKDKGNNVTLYYSGETDAIDEIIAFGYGNEVGVGIARILGDNMNPNAIIKMLKSTQLDNSNVNLSQFKLLFDEMN